MTASALEVRIRQDEQRVDVNRFLTAVGNVATALREIDRAAVPRGESRAVWVVDDLSHERTMLTVRLAARTAKAKRDAASLLMPIEALVEGVKVLEHQPELPRFYSENTVSRLLRIGERHRGVQEVSLATVNGKVGPHVDLSTNVFDHAREAVRGHDVAAGSVSGSLDILNGRLKSGIVKVSILDSVTRRGVTGTAPPAFADRVREAWGHRVTVVGDVTRNERGQAVKIAIRHLELLPEDDSGRPSTDELIGISPSWLGDHTVDEYMKEVRGRG
jgi:hypothetical protein